MSDRYKARYVAPQYPEVVVILDAPYGIIADAIFVLYRVDGDKDHPVVPITLRYAGIVDG